MAKKKIVDAEADSKGNITAVRFRGNSTFTPLDAAVRIADRGQIDGAHSVHPVDGAPHLRANPDGRKANNLDELAKK